MPQAHSHYDSHAADTNAPNNMLTHIKSGYGFLNVYMRYTNTFLIHSRFCSLCILLRRKVLACSTYLLASMTDHPCRDLLFMYMRCVPHNHPYWLCLSPTRSRSGIDAGNLLYRHNEGKQISENQYFHVDTSLFLAYYIQKTGCESGIYIQITGVYCSITFGFLCFLIRWYIPFYRVAKMHI